MHMWAFDGARLNFDRIEAFGLSQSLCNFLHCRVLSLCNQLLPEFSMAPFKTLQTYC